MKGISTLLIVVAGLSIAGSLEYGGGHALFVKTSASAAEIDQLAARQQSDPPGYLPPYTTQRPPERPRPFQAPSTGQQPTYSSPTQNGVTNYPYQRPPSGFSSSTVQPPPFSTQRQTYLPPNHQSPYGPSSYNPRPTPTPSYTGSGSSTFPPFSSTSRPPSTTLSSQPGFSTSGGVSTTYGYSTQRPPSPTYVPSASSGSSAPGYPPPGGYPSSTTYGYPSVNLGPSYPTVETGVDTYDQSAPGGYPASPSYPSSVPDQPFPSLNTDGGSSASDAAKPSGTGGSTGEGTSSTGTVTGEETEDDEDLNHPPHIHALDVECSKTMMTIDIEFNRVFEGVIYSKGFFMNPECRYVEENSGQTKYSFTVSLDSCGTQFINDFAGEAGQAYLENVLNEPGIQEVWDTVRRVRCLWEGNINKALSVNFSVDMLNQEIVTFSGDTAIAKLDIQVGRGPFAPAADGLVKIGEIMTLVVTVEGDPAFDLQVRDCLARDESSSNTIQLTDERGCILKPKLFGAFQKTNDTGNTGASIIAYAYFQAFKFPDVMDLFIECNIELCKTDCEPCPEPNQQIEPRRRRRSLTYTSSNTPLNNSAVLLADPIRVARGFRVIMVDDLSKASNQVLEQLEETAVEEVARTTTNLCMTYSGFYTAISFMFSTVLLATISAVALYVKLQRVYRSKTIVS
ncbi:cut-4 [Anthophora plagiata]